MTVLKNLRFRKACAMVRYPMPRFCRPLALVSICALIWICALGSEGSAQQLTVQEIPSPRPTGWVVDMTGQISTESIASINTLCDEVAKKYDGEIAVVLVGTTGGQDHRRFATELFNHWGIGSARANNGILVFAAMNDRRAEIVLGEGISNRNDVNNTDVIMDRFMMPEFKLGNYGGGLYESVRASATRVFGIATLESPVHIPPDAGARAAHAEKTRGGRRENGMVNQLAGGRRGFNPLPWLIGLGGVGGLGLVVGGRYYLRYRRRYCDECGQEMVRLDEQQDDQFLDSAEVVEERIGSVDYDVWACLQCEFVDKFRYGKFFSRYATCPQCEYKTKTKVERTLIAATQSRGGKVRVREWCEYCSFSNHYTYRTARLPKPSSSSSSSSGGSSFGGGGGGSGFGGGSSSGAGSSGSW